MYGSVTSCTLVGVEPRPVRIEATISPRGRSRFSIVGLPDTAVRESRERVTAAIRQQGFSFPPGHVVVNLSPADLPKGGVAFDLPIALSILSASERTPVGFDDFVCVGELSLRGEVKPVRTALGASILADAGEKTCMVASSTTISAGPDSRILGVRSLREAVEVGRGTAPGDPVMEPEPVVTATAVDLSMVRGNVGARRALEVAAAGGHHMMMIGSPGGGKTLLASCLTGILPPLTDAQFREVCLIAAAAGQATPTTPVAPFRAPHHSASIPALVGGGTGIPTPGEVSLAHCGVLFLDELGEFNPSVLDALRQPIENGSIHIARQGAHVVFPSSVQVIAASNPCPCGYEGDHRVPCRCGVARKERYAARLSGPLLDRFDMRMSVPSLTSDELLSAPGESSRAVRERVVPARALQELRGTLNRDLTRPQLDDMPMSAEAERILRRIATRDDVTGRGWDRIRRLARTIADLAERETIDSSDVEEALTLRGAS